MNGIRYRYSDHNASIEAEVWKTIKKTPKGRWIEDRYGLRRWMLDRGNFAFSNRKDAWLSFQKRKRKQVIALKMKLRNAEECLRVSKNLAPPIRDTKMNELSFVFTEFL